jgi:hypothetical protein
MIKENCRGLIKKTAVEPAAAVAAAEVADFEFAHFVIVSKEFLSTVANI